MSRRQHVGPNVIVMSSAGKPIFSRFGHEEDLSSACSLVQAIRASIHQLDGSHQGGGDIHSLEADDLKMVFLTIGSLTLVAISDEITEGECCDTEAYLRLQLEYVYGQIIFTLTDTIQSVFHRKHNFDMREMLGATDVVIRGLLDRAGPSGNGGSFLCAGVETVWPLPFDLRDHASMVLSSVCGEHSSTCLFAILLVGNSLLSIVMPKYRPHQLNASDINLILNFCTHQPGILTNKELWFPVCLPRFNSSGFVYAYTNCLDSGSGLACVLVSQRNTTEQFAIFQEDGASIRRKLGLPPPKRGPILRLVDDGDGSGASSTVPNDSAARVSSEEDNTNYDDIAWQRKSDNEHQSGEESFTDLHDSGFSTEEIFSVPASQSNADSELPVGGELTIVKVLNEVRRDKIRENQMEKYLQIAQALHFVFRIDVAAQDTGGVLTQCLSPPLKFPFVDEKSKARVHAMYQRLALRLRLGSASMESTIDAFEVIADERDSADGRHTTDIGEDCPAQCLAESPPHVHGVTYILDGPELFIGINGKDFELYAVLPGKIPPRNATRLCSKLIRKLFHHEGTLFLAYPRLFHRR